MTVTLGVADSNDQTSIILMNILHVGTTEAFVCNYV